MNFFRALYMQISTKNISNIEMLQIFSTSLLLFGDFDFSGFYTSVSSHIKKTDRER